MKKGVMVAMLFMLLTSFAGVGMADMLVKGTVILISGISSDMYTVKTENDQGFGGSRETFYVDPKMTKKTGEIKVGTEVEAEVNANGTAYWIKAVEATKNETKNEAKKPAEK
ncbi:MAG TPA: hypothetical protein VLY20_10505 [Nitrospiria bacterium]|nr:hypothetical protein [Nitrospiria bacterium]